MSQRRDPHEERRKLFRKMEWVFVYAPPLLAIFIAAFGAMFLAFFVPIGEYGLWARWGMIFGLVMVLSFLAHLVWSRLNS